MWLIITSVEDNVLELVFNYIAWKAAIGPIKQKLTNYKSQMCSSFSFWDLPDLLLGARCVSYCNYIITILQPSVLLCINLMTSWVFTDNFHDSSHILIRDGIIFELSGYRKRPFRIFDGSNPFHWPAFRLYISISNITDASEDLCLRTCRHTLWRVGELKPNKLCSLTNFIPPFRSHKNVSMRGKKTKTVEQEGTSWRLVQICWVMF